jgi:hypothetical protein
MEDILISIIDTKQKCDKFIDFINTSSIKSIILIKINNENIFELLLKYYPNIFIYECFIFLHTKLQNMFKTKKFFIYYIISYIFRNVNIFTLKILKHIIENNNQINFSKCKIQITINKYTLQILKLYNTNDLNKIIENLFINYFQ